MKKQFTELIGICCMSVFLFLISSTGAFAQYCSVSASNPTDDFLTNVTFAGIDNTTGSTAAGYTDYTDISGSVVPGLTYSFSGTVDNVSSFGTIWDENIVVYIDWDQSQTFDPTERYEMGSCSTTNCTLTGDIAVPVDATPGETRMRVLEKYGSTFSYPDDACSSYTYGEVEDYAIIVESGECTPPDFDFVVTNDCVNDTYAVTATLNDFGTSNFITIYLTRSDEVAVNNVTLPFVLQGQTVNIIVNVPFGVTVEASIEGSNPVCNLTRTWEELICPAENDEACTATELFCGDTLVDQVFLGSTQSIDDDCGGSATGDVWYKFTSDGLEKYIIEETQSDVVVDLWSGDDCGALVQISECQDYPESFEITEAGTYYYRVRPWGSATDYGVTLACIPFDCPDLLADIESPCDDGNPNTVNDMITENCECVGVPQIANDEACTATLIACGGTITQSFIGATMSIDDACGGSSSADVWVKFVSDGSQVYTIAEEGVESIDAIVQLYVGDDCGNLTEASECVDFGESFTVFEAGTYYFRIRPYSTSYEDDLSTITLTCTPFDCPEVGGNIGGPCDDGDPNTSGDTVTDSCECVGFPIPTNDEACNAIVLACGDTLLAQTMMGATPSIVDDCTNPENGDIWFSFTTQEGFITSVELDGDGPSSTSLTGQIFIGDDCNGLIAVTDCDNFVTGYTGGDTAATFYLRVRPYSNAESLDITVTCAEIPTNADCSTAAPVACFETVTGSTLGAPLLDPDQSFCGTSSPGGSNGGVWYSYTPTSDVIATFDLNLSSYDTKIFLYSGSCDSLVCIDGDDDGGDLGNTSRLEATLEANVTYYIFISGYSSNRGTYVMEVTCQDLECSPTIANMVAVDQAGDSLECVASDGDYYVAVTLSGGGDTGYNVSANGGTSVAVAPNGTVVVGPVSGLESAEISVTGAINTNCSASGTFEPSVYCPPSNDDACGAPTLVCGDTLVVSTQGATSSFDDDCGGSSDGDVWVKFVSDGSQVYTIAEGGGSGSFDAVVQLFEGDDCGNLTALSECDDYPEEFAILEAGTYYFRIRSYFSSETDNANITLTCSPFECPELGTNIGLPCDDGNPNTVNDVANDNCECAGTPIITNDEACTATLMACGETLSQSFAGATMSIDDACNGSSTSDVWVKFVSDGSQVYTIAEGGGDYFDAVVQLFEGDDCGNLTALSECDDYPEEFTVFEAGTYYFRIRSYSSSETDNANITLTCSPFDCPELGTNIGLPCDDGNPNTVNDVADDNCECVGVPQVANDEACTATLMACGDTLSQSFAGATMSIDDACNGSSTSDVWVKFVSDGSQVYTIAEGGAESIDAIVQLYVGDDCGNLTEASECVDFGENFTVFDAGTYYFRIRPYSTSAEDDLSTITLTCTPFDCPEVGGNIGGPCDDGNPNTVGDVVDENCGCAGIPIATNDEPCTATAIACGDTILQSTAGATQTMDPITCDNYTADQAMDVWFSFEADGVSGYIVKDIAGDDLVIEVFSSDGCQSLTASIGCGDVPETIDLGVLSAGTYFVRAYAYSDSNPFYEVEMVLECINNSTASLGGSVTWNSSCGERDAVVSLYEPGTATLVATYNTTVAADGTFSIDDVEIGTFDVIFDVAGYLATGIEDVVIAVGENSLSVGALVNGDINGDNTVNLFDLSLANASYGDAVGDANYNPLADLNCDGFVNLFDLSLANASYGQTGVSAPL